LLQFGPNNELFASKNKIGLRWQVDEAAGQASEPRLARLPLRLPEHPSSLCLCRLGVVMNGAEGSKVVPFAALDTSPAHWRSTIAGVSHASPDGRWLGIFAPFTAMLRIYQLPGMEPVAEFHSVDNIGDFMFSPRGNEVAVQSNHGVEFVSTESWQRTRSMT